MHDVADGPQSSGLQPSSATDLQRPRAESSRSRLVTNRRRSRIASRELCIGLAPSGGLEPPTPGLGNRCSIP